MATRHPARQAARRRSGRVLRGHSGPRKILYSRTLRYEPLEDRRLLALVTVDTPLDTVDLDDGLTSLREAIFATNLVSGPDEIRFDFGHDGPETIVLTQGELRITDDLTINGPSAELLTIDASGNDPTPDINDGMGSRVFNIDDGTPNLIDVAISGVTLTGGDVRSNGGGVLSVEGLLLSDSVVTGNHARSMSPGRGGGGVYIGGGSVSISDSTIAANTVLRSISSPLGAGLHSKDASVSIAGSTVSDNRDGQGIVILNAPESAISESTISGNTYGGFTVRSTHGATSIADTMVSQNTLGGIALYLEGGSSATIVRSTITGNIGGGSDRGLGGGIYGRVQGGGSLSILDSMISLNTQALSGGGVFLSVGADSSANLARSEVYANKTAFSGVSGAGLAIDSFGVVVIRDSKIYNNESSGEGGGIQFAGDLTIERSSITGNKAAERGGGILNGFGSTNGSLRLIDSDVSGNTAKNGGGIALREPEQHTILRSRVTGNRAVGGFPANYFAVGGGILAVAGSLQIIESTIENNSALGAGGGIYAGRYATVALEDVTISDNSASHGGGIFSRVPFSVNGSTINNNSADFGGGINSSGALSVTQSTIGGNYADHGGGIQHNSGELIVSDSTISGNSAEGEGGGIQNVAGSLTVGQSTISGNEAQTGGGIHGVSTVSFSTITKNQSGGLIGDSELDHTIVAGNSTEAGNPLDVEGVINARFSLVGAGAEFLGPLADNGGPTMTHALLPGSPAINAGDLNAKAGVGAVPLYDQRGEPFSRVVNGRIDIGAFEYQEPSDLNLLVDTLADESDGNHGRGDLSLREAIELANLYPSTDTIRFDPALFAAGPATILLTQGQLRITDDLTITGPGAELLTIDASGNDPTPTVNDGRGSGVFSAFVGNRNVAIRDLTLTGSDSGGFGGAITAIANLTVADCIIVDNASSSFIGGGGIYSSGLSLTVVRTIISGNSALRADGGGIRKTGGVLIIEDSTISDNAADTTGGGIFAEDSVQVHIRNSTIRNNSTHSGWWGGGLYLFRGVGESTIEGTTITGNSSGGGGGIRITDARLTVTGSTISGNSAVWTGGGIWSSGHLTLVRSVITGNSTASGGGIFAEDFGTPSSLTLFETTISNNSARFNGGGIISRGVSLSAIGCTISGNSADGIGGGIALIPDTSGRAGVISLVSSTVSGNRSKQHGGGVYVDGYANSTHTISHSTIAFNASDADLSGSGSGGGLFVRRGLIDINHSIIARNVDLSEIGPDLTGFLGSVFVVTHSLIGTNTGSGLAQVNVGSPDSNGNLIGGGRSEQINPLLGTLTDNGGPTLTHALLPGSPAINAGDPAAVAGVGGVPLFDQRGAPFTRVHGGRIDIGAFESQPEPLPGDYNLNGVVDAADVIVWRKTLNSTTDLRADGNGDGIVNDADWLMWRANFGRRSESLEQGARSMEPEGSQGTPHQSAWQPAAPPGVHTVPRPAWRTPPARFALSDHLRPLLASPRTISNGRAAFTPAKRLSMRDANAESTDSRTSALDQVFESLGATVAGTLRVP